MGALNAHRTGRLQSAVVWLVALLLSYFVFEWWMVKTASGVQASLMLTDALGREGHRLLLKALGLIYFAIVNLAFLREERTASLMDAPRPNGTWIGIGVAIVGIVASVLITQGLS